MPIAKPAVDTVLISATLRWIDNSLAAGIFTTDANLTIRSWNHWLELHTGRTAEEVVGRNLFDTFQEIAQRGLDRCYVDVLGGDVRLLCHKFHKFLLAMPSTVTNSGADLM